MKTSERGPRFLDPKSGEHKKDQEELRKAATQEMAPLASGMAFCDFRIEGEFNDSISHFNGDINKIHQTSFLEKEIPEAISACNGKRKVKILVLGVGAGFFTSQIREKFPQDVKVIGTSALAINRRYRKRVGELRQRRIEEVERMNITLEPDTPDYYAKLPEAQDARKAQMAGFSRSPISQSDFYKTNIYEFRDFPEFDLIIDTYGDVSYSGQQNDQQGDDNPLSFEKKIEMALKKLLPGGKFFLGACVKEQMAFLWDNGEKLEQKYGIKIFFNNLTQADIFEKMKGCCSDLDDNDFNNSSTIYRKLKLRAIEYLKDKLKEDEDGVANYKKIISFIDMIINMGTIKILKE